MSLQLSTEPNLAAGGDAIARHPDGRVVFVSGAAPDETVEVEILKDNPTFLRARVTRVVTPGPHRVEAPCPHYAGCGGCSLQHVTREAQLAGKQVGLRDALTRIGKLDLDAVDVLPPWGGPAYGYRTRARLALSDRGQVGFRQGKSRRVIDVRQCPVLAPELQDVLTTLRAAVKRETETGRGDKRGPAEVALVSNGEEVLAQFPPGSGGLMRAVGRAAGPVVRMADDAIADAKDGKGALLLSPRVFAQASRDGNLALIDQIEAWIPTKTSLAVDLYSGSGNFTRTLAARAGQVEAFEGSREAVALARRAAPDHVRVHLADVAKAFTAWVGEGHRPDVVLADPPRSGLAPEVVDAILRAQPAQFVYVSCDPATFARDVAKLVAGGLRFRRVRLFDVYPQTGHSEVVGLLQSGA